MCVSCKNNTELLIYYTLKYSKIKCIQYFTELAKIPA